jgi:hypothetical protein
MSSLKLSILEGLDILYYIDKENVDALSVLHYGDLGGLVEGGVEQNEVRVP